MTGLDVANIFVWIQIIGIVVVVFILSSMGIQRWLQPVTAKEMAKIRLLTDDPKQLYIQIEGGKDSLEPGVPYAHIWLGKVGATSIRDQITEWLAKGEGD